MAWARKLSHLCTLSQFLPARPALSLQLLLGAIGLVLWAKIS